MKRFALMALCVAIPHTTSAATIIWEAFGTVGATDQYGAVAPPPDSTPWALRLQFDPDLIGPSPGSHWPPGAPCSMVPISGSFMLGGADYTFGGGSNLAFTNAMLPYDNCGSYGSGTVQFFMFPRSTDDPWRLWGLGGSFLLASYEDLYQNGTIPTEPVYSHPGYLVYRNDSFRLEANFSPEAVQQPAPIPEPATTTLVGLGLALISGRKWLRRRRTQ